ncbi:TonB-dependent receptor [bacterium]|nr:MAG: TonB-dependent receptor [bacterium]
MTKYYFNYTYLFALLIIFFSAISVFGQSGTIQGRIQSDSETLAGANIFIKSLKKGAVSNLEGVFVLENIPFGNYDIHVSLVGYKSKTIQVLLENTNPVQLNVSLDEDILNLEQVVVTGTRSEIVSYQSPVIISNIGKKTFENVQALCLAEGLNFSPGLRIENNCQNCGFVQLRMNGLDGPYSQILINSRPVFSALAGVYGLEMIPAEMIDRIEVVRGGGSVLYGGNAIAGTVNIITKEPIQNDVQFGLNQAFLNAETPDRALHINGTVVSSDFNHGLTFYGFNRNRDFWDANGDGFSEITKQENNTLGFDAFWNPDVQSKMKLSAYTIKEFRRGGNEFHLAPHQTDLTEQLKHIILGSTISYERVSEQLNHKFSVYGSLQTVNRDSYYGGGGRVLNPGDELTESDVLALNAYGNSSDWSTAVGVQYSYVMSENSSLTTGSEWQMNHVLDDMPGYQRLIDQKVQTIGNYAQLQWIPVQNLTVLSGARVDVVQIHSMYHFSSDSYLSDDSYVVFVPRFALMYDWNEQFKSRVSFAQGYRAPQAFNEDLHIETVGGAARFVQLSPDLKMEKSQSVTASLNYTKPLGYIQTSAVLEYFYTRLTHPFILTNPIELVNGVSQVTKSNGSGAFVQGVNIELNLGFGKQFVMQTGLTVQQGKYDMDEVIWSPQNEPSEQNTITTKKMLRTPDVYGYATFSITPIKKMNWSYTGVFTGKMTVPHMIDSQSEFTVLKQTPSFFEQSIKMSYEFNVTNGLAVDWFFGVQNLTNSYQSDFDAGATRDAGYVYGPMRPRTFYSGFNVEF